MPYTVSPAREAPIRRRLPRTSTARAVAAAMAVAGALPYAALKVAWLAGSSVGTTTAAAAAELHDARHVAGNVLTLALELAAVLLALALVRPWGRRLPAPVVLVPIWVGTGLLAPVAVGLPLGLVAQAFAGGAPAPSDSGLEPWVYALVYGGFVVQAAAIGTAFVLYARDRWASVVRAGAVPPAPSARRALAVTGSAAAAAYALVNVAWTVGGESAGAPAGFETAAQRSLLLATGALALAGAAGVLQLALGWRPRWAARRPWTPLALAWVGSATAFASGIAQVGLAAEGADAATGVVLAVGTASGLALAISAARAVPRRPPGGASEVHP